MSDKQNKKTPLSNVDLEFEVFHSICKQKIADEKLLYQKSFYSQVHNELSQIVKEKRNDRIQELISANNLEAFELDGLNRYNRLEELELENVVLFFLEENYLAINFVKNSAKFQTSYFQYNNTTTTDEKIGKLYKGLKDFGYIDCSRYIFRSIFSIKKNPEKVNWLKSLSSFQFFIQELVKKESILTVSLWVSATSCFTIKGNEKTNRQLSKTEKPTYFDRQNLLRILKEF